MTEDEVRKIVVEEIERRIDRLTRLLLATNTLLVERNALVDEKLDQARDAVEKAVDMGRELLDATKAARPSRRNKPLPKPRTATVYPLADFLRRTHR